MRRGALFVAVVLAVLVAAGLGAAASSKDYTGPSCLNIISGDGSYGTAANGDAVLSWDAQTEAATCASATYTLYVEDASGNPITSQAVSGGTSQTCTLNGPSGSTCVPYSIDLGPAASAPSAICIYGTSQKTKNVSDRAPDDGCFTLLLDGGGTGSFGYH